MPQRGTRPRRERPEPRLEGQALVHEEALVLAPVADASIDEV